jgi:hypothetical protein
MRFPSTLRYTICSTDVRKALKGRCPMKIRSCVIFVMHARFDLQSADSRSITTYCDNLLQCGVEEYQKGCPELHKVPLSVTQLPCTMNT